MTGSNVLTDRGSHECVCAHAIARSGSVSKLLMFAVGSVLAGCALLLAAFNLRPDATRAGHDVETVRVYCASGVARPIEQIIDAYNEQFAAKVTLARTGGSGELAGQIKAEFETHVRASADLYVSADQALLDSLDSEGVITERFPIAEQRPVIAIRSDTQLRIGSLTDLVSRGDVKFGVASQRAAVGKLVRQIARQEGVLEALETNKVTDAENVMTLAQALVAGSLEAAVIWDTTVNQLNQFKKGAAQELKVAAFADPGNVLKSHIAVGVVASVEHPMAARKFCRYLSNAVDSKEVFEQAGYTMVPTGE